MTESEHLLTCLSEEAAEVALAISKALRFGLADGYPGTDRTNAGDIAKEVNDLVAVVELLEERGIVPRTHTLRDIEEKKVRVLHYIEYAKSKGTISRLAGAPDA